MVGRVRGQCEGAGAVSGGEVRASWVRAKVRESRDLDALKVLTRRYRELQNLLRRLRSATCAGPDDPRRRAASTLCDNRRRVKFSAVSSIQQLFG